MNYPDGQGREQWLQAIEKNRNPFFAHPEDPDQTLWRYMDFAKFVALLHRAELFFPSAASLGDTFEGSVTAETLRVRAMPVEERIAHMQRNPRSFGRFIIAADASTDSRDYFSRSALGENGAQELKWQRYWTFISCWHMNDHESAPMWRLYAASNQAIAVQTTFQRLQRCLRPHVMPPHGEPILGKVNYLDYRAEVISPYDHLAHFFHKRASFAYEAEVRAVMQALPLVPASWDASGKVTGSYYDHAKPYELGRPLSVDLGDLIETVRIAPGAPGWLTPLTEEMLRKYGLHKSVLRSELDGHPVY